MTTELSCLVWVTGLTGLLWAPYAANRAMIGGLLREVGYPEPPTVLSPWAARLKKAHDNAVENLVVFAPLVLVVHLLGKSSPLTVWAATAYLWARVVHAGAYTLKISWVRTIAFTVGWGCQMALAGAL